MKFNVADLLKERAGAAREFDLDDDVMRMDGVDRRLKGHVRFDRTRDGVLVRAMVRGSAPSECSRCLRPISVEVDLRIEEEFIPTVDVLTGARVTPPEGEEDAYRIDERHMIDLRESIGQYWMMAMPMAPLCNEACEGLCPDCGEQRQAGHACVDRQEDARWSKLRDLKLG
jgi:uncharacterized protein